MALRIYRKNPASPDALIIFRYGLETTPTGYEYDELKGWGYFASTATSFIITSTGPYTIRHVVGTYVPPDPPSASSTTIWTGSPAFTMTAFES